MSPHFSGLESPAFALNRCRDARCANDGGMNLYGLLHMLARWLAALLKNGESDKNGENGRKRRASVRRAERDDADGAAQQLGAGAGDLDVAQRLPVLEETGRPARQHVAGLAERDGEAAVV